MIIYRDIISHDELFSDIYKIREIADGLCLEVEGKMVSRTEGNIDDSLIGGNASAEGPEGEGTESTVVTGVDIVMNHHLQETSFTKEAYKTNQGHMKPCLKDRAGAGVIAHLLCRSVRCGSNYYSQESTRQKLGELWGRSEGEERLEETEGVVRPRHALEPQPPCAGSRGRISCRLLRVFA
ncbi:TPT1-like protein [Alexandromys fortis]|uniref:TPT1-like protein n=1 Tax=Alexandromys fortis TaxID=100897 RepID=UPI002152C4BC|nr:TPT1-like protein [Microtus fortis]